MGFAREHQHFVPMPEAFARLPEESRVLEGWTQIANARLHFEASRVAATLKTVA